MNIKKIHLEAGEFYTEIVKKTMIVIHHTAGSHRPDFTINGWEHDKTKSGGALQVGTAYLIGGISTTDGDATWDGQIVEAFDDKFWAHHLGLKTANNTELNKKSIGIELCNYGPLIKTKDGKFLNYVNKEIPLEMVGTLVAPFRGFQYYHKYTEKQLESLLILLKALSAKHEISLKNGLFQIKDLNAKSFDLCSGALMGGGGLWSHGNFRSDKFDVWPQPELMNLIKNI